MQQLRQRMPAALREVPGTAFMIALSLVQFAFAALAAFADDRGEDARTLAAVAVLTLALGAPMVWAYETTLRTDENAPEDLA